MQTGEQHAASARLLLAGTFQGILSSHSLEHPGYPFGSVVPFVLDEDGVPLLLLSHLAQHTRNLEARPQCGLTIIEPGDGDIQQLSRLSAMGDMHRDGSEEGIQRYFRHFPQTRVYHTELGFHFFRFRPMRFHWNAGFATARWFDPSRILHRNVFEAELEQQLLAQLNAEHPEILSHCLKRYTRMDADTEVVIVGIDGEGMNLRIADHLVRIAFPSEVSSVDQARSVLIRMAQQLD